MAIVTKRREIGLKLVPKPSIYIYIYMEEIRIGIVQTQSGMNLDEI
jgi:hypothetical protein